MRRDGLVHIGDIISDMLERGWLNVETDNVKIIQIMPATGWYALYYFEGEPHYDLSPIAAWALCQYSSVVDEWKEVRAVDFDADGTADFANEATNFIRYVHQSDLDSGRVPREGLEQRAIEWLAKKA